MITAWCGDTICRRNVLNDALFIGASKVPAAVVRFNPHQLLLHKNDYTVFQLNSMLLISIQQCELLFVVPLSPINITQNR